MKISRSILLYKDEPGWGFILKFIATVIPASMLIMSVYLWTSGDNTGSIVLLAEAVFVSIIFWAVFPRSYQVYDDHLSIGLGGPFAINIGFETIERVETTRRTVLTVNFATRMTGKYVRIVVRNGLSIAITPKDDELFVNNANRALEEWLITKPFSNS